MARESIVRQRITVEEYLALPEQQSPQELVWGVVREPPAPFVNHQATVGRIYSLLDAHVRAHGLGAVYVSPLDVVLDAERGLVVQPDVVLVTKNRMDIVRDQVWGPPDLVVEVASRKTIWRDRTTKLGWYRRYGVRECWLVAPNLQRVVIADLTRTGRQAFRFHVGDDRLQSAVLPLLDEPASRCFD
jgi:Uma2 family endonuclease